jgi:hypothetical protein
MLVVREARFERVYERYKATRRHVLVDKNWEGGYRWPHNPGSWHRVALALSLWERALSSSPTLSFSCPVSLYLFVSRV